jgi:predicted DNA-binding transcriptional regulator YafY
MRADRLLSLMFMLGSGERLTAQALAERLEVSERTVYRDVDALSSVGVPVYTQPGANGGIFLDENYRISLGGFSRADLQSLFVSADAGPLSDLGLVKEDTLLKLFVALPAIQRHEVERVQQRFFIDPTNWFQLVEASSDFAVLQQAVWEDRVIQVTYQPVEGAVGERELEAYALVAKANIWYLVGRKPGGEMRNFRVSRFESVTLTDTTFARDASLDLPAYWKASCEQFERVSKGNTKPYMAILRVHPRMFWYFPGWMNGRYEKLGTPDAEGWITVRAVYDSMEQARTQVLGFGTYAEALDPPELSASVIETAEAILKWHAERSVGKKLTET